MPRLPGKRKLPGTELSYASLSEAKENALSRRYLVKLAASPRECVIRVGGGAARMGKHGFDVGNFLATALGGPACDSAVLAGATMAIDRPESGICTICDKHRVHCPMHGFGHIKPKPGVMDVLMNLAAMDAPARTIGLIPTINETSYYGGFIMVEDDPDDNYYTVVDGRAPICLMLQFSTDKPKLTWDHEWQVTLDYMEILRDEAEHRSLHLMFNGGDTTYNEIMHVASLPQDDNPWNLLLVEDAGRMSQKMAEDVEFRNMYPHVQSCKVHELATVIREMKFSPAITDEQE